MSYASCNIQENRIEGEEKEVKERCNDFRQVIREENDQQQWPKIACHWYESFSYENKFSSVIRMHECARGFEPGLST